VFLQDLEIPPGTCAYHNIECIGIYRGYQGMIEGDFKEMGPQVWITL
jgi:6-phosphofructokinase